MSSEVARAGVQFKRRYIKTSPSLPAAKSPAVLESVTPLQREKPLPADVNVLVINDSHAMAKEITMQLTLALPGCSITYAPTIELAKWILSRRKISLVVSSPVLPDGGIARLRDSLQKLNSPPDVVVVGDLALRSAELFKESSYEFAAVRRMGGRADLPAPISKNRPTAAASNQAAPPPVDTKIRALGADIRNDLNNPLQEIVAMVFVAQAAGALAEPTSHALEAIDKAAKNMAQVVSKLEDKIFDVVKR